MVAISAFGGLNIHIMTSSRMCFVDTRNGHFPEMFRHINIGRFTPTPALVFLVFYFLNSIRKFERITISFMFLVHFIISHVSY